MKVVLDGKTLDVSPGTKVIDIVEPGTLACIVDNYLESLNYEIHSEVEVKSVSLSSILGQRIFERSLVFVLVRATRELYPDARVVVRHAISNGIFVDIKNIGQAMSPAVAKTIAQRMREIISSNEPFVKEIVRKREAEKFFLEDGQMDKVELLRQRPEEYVPIYSLGWYKDYAHLPVVSHAGLLQDFDLKFYLPGVILILPSYFHGGKVGPYMEQPKLAQVFSEEEKRAEILEVSDVTSLNRQIKTDPRSSC